MLLNATRCCQSWATSWATGACGRTADWCLSLTTIRLTASQSPGIQLNDHPSTWRSRSPVDDTPRLLHFAHSARTMLCRVSHAMAMAGSLEHPTTSFVSVEVWDGFRQDWSALSNKRMDQSWRGRPSEYDWHHPPSFRSFLRPRRATQVMRRR